MSRTTIDKCHLCGGYHEGDRRDKRPAERVVDAGLPFIIGIPILMMIVGPILILLGGEELLVWLAVLLVPPLMFGALLLMFIDYNDSSSEYHRKYDHWLR